MEKRHIKLKFISYIFAAVLAFSSPVRVFAGSGDGAYEPDPLDESAVSDNSVEEEQPAEPESPVQIPAEDIFSVVLPVVEDSDPFSFFIDPNNYLYDIYRNSKDVSVEEGANLLFINRQFERSSLSSTSDKLTIINQSTVPVDVTITAKIENIDGISMTQDTNFADSQDCNLYLALVDNEGNEQPLSETGEISITVRLDQMIDDSKGTVYDTYNFGLKGACNREGDWASLACSPYVTVSWNVEPVISDENQHTDESVIEDSSTDDSVVEEPSVEDNQSITDQTEPNQDESVIEPKEDTDSNEDDDSESISENEASRDDTLEDDDIIDKE